MPLPPDAEAVALITPKEAPEAENDTEPPELMLDEVVAIALSSTIARPRAAPTAALPPAAVPLASVPSVDSCTVLTVTSPVVVKPPLSAPIVASVSSFKSASATTGVTATPPDAPWSAWVTATWVASAVSPTVSAPVNVTPSDSSA